MVGVGDFLRERVKVIATVYSYFSVFFLVLALLSIFVVAPVFTLLKTGIWGWPELAKVPRFAGAAFVAALVPTVVLYVFGEYKEWRSGNRR
jgi:hypothetical protein